MRRALRAIDGVIRPRGYVYPGWWIVLGGVGIQVLVGALLMQSYGAYLVLLQEEFGWSKTLLAGAFAMARIESGILGPLQGWLLDRFGPRVVMRVGIGLFGLGFLLFSRIDSLVGFYATFFLMALGSSLGGFVSITVAVVNWFRRHRAKAVAFSQAGLSLGGLAVPGVVLALDGWGWRATAAASGALILALGLPLTRAFEQRPERVGEELDGLPADAPSGRRGAGRAPQMDFSARQALRTRAFWCLSAGHAIALLVVSAVLVHLVPHLTESLGYSLAGAGAVISLMTAAQLFGQLSGGALGDRYDKRVICALCMLAHGASLLLLANAQSAAAVTGFALLHGWAWGTRGPLMAAIRADFFGASSFGTITGFSSLIVMMGMTAGPLIAGSLADLQGSYGPGLGLIGAVALGGSLFFAVLRPPRGTRPRCATGPAGRAEACPGGDSLPAVAPAGAGALPAGERRDPGRRSTSP